MKLSPGADHLPILILKLKSLQSKIKGSVIFDPAKKTTSSSAVVRKRCTHTQEAD
jgi:hypothetical protein